MKNIRKITVQAVISILMSFLITVDWPGEGSSALCGFTKDAFSLTVTTRVWKNGLTQTVPCVWVHAGVCVCLIFAFLMKRFLLVFGLP